MGAVIACLIGLYATLGYYYNLPVPEEISNTYYLSDPTSFAEVSRIRSVASEPRFFTYYLITILPFLIITGLYKQYIISRRFHIGALILIGLSFWWTMSRSMIVLGFVAIAILPFISMMIGSKLSHYNPVVSLTKAALTLIILLALAAGLLFIISGVNLGSALFSLAETINPYHRSLSSQLINNIVAINLFLENPILGVGIGNYVFFASPSAIPAWSPLYHDISDTVVFVTNVYLQTLSEVGIVGMVMLLYLFGTIGLSIIRTIRMAKDARSSAMGVGLAGSFVMIAVAVAFIPNFFNPETWVVLGFIAVVWRHVRSDQSLGATL
jgi:O-antigen ligase